MAVAFFDRIRLPDVLDTPLLRDACGDWFRDIVRALFGSRDPATNIRYVREIFALVGKGNSKTTYSAALMVVALLMNVRKRVEFHFLAPVQKTAEQAYDSAKGMIEADPQLNARFHCRDHKKEIFDRVNKAKLAVKTFDLKTMTGPKPAGVMVDEIHLLAKSAHTAKVLRQIRGGLEKNTDGFLIFITTQSDDVPVGAFESELKAARAIRDGKRKGRMLPVLYEFPEDIAKDPSKWKDPRNWPMVMPNLGRSLQIDSLIADLEAEIEKGIEAERLWYSQHLSIQIGVGLGVDRWAGAEFWSRAADKSLTFDEILKRSEAVVFGIDGGGLDDLFGFVMMGRCRETKRWLMWSHAWCHVGVLARRKSIAALLQGFKAAGELTIVDDELEDTSEIVDIIAKVKDRGLLAAVAVDPMGLEEFVGALKEIEVTEENGLLIGLAQGGGLMSAIKATERAVVRGQLKTCPSGLMDWAVGNLKIESLATTIRATKQNAGDAKIDPALAMFDAAAVMVKNPEPKGGSVYDNEDTYREAFGGPAAESEEDDDGVTWKSSILADPDHPLFAEHRQRFEAWQDQQDDD